MIPTYILKSIQKQNTENALLNLGKKSSVLKLKFLEQAKDF